ncbi:MAG: carbohydrate-binding module 48 [Leptospiraceae bacterium]|nr:glycogen-binding domain-containing protein [Leptospiraceae bacterium]MCP5512252.1 carbohydrate-binding module 48 [Leptospiraceae bacterium]
MKHKKTKNSLFRTFLLIVTFSLGGVFAQETLDWLGSYSSREMEGLEDRNNTGDKVYYFWQIQSLKRAVPPRYIRMIDIENYTTSYSFLNKGILFTYNGLMNSEVEICGNFSAWRCHPMKRNRYGIYYLIIPPNFKGRNETDETSYEYKFRVDGIFDFDPENSDRIEDGEGSFFSLFTLNRKDFEKQITYRIIDSEIEEDLDFKTIEFRIYKPEASTIALVGDFNQWNPEHDYLEKESNGLFILRKKLKPGEYLYNFIVDGHTQLDTYNTETRFRVETEDLCSYIMISGGNDKDLATNP